MIQGAADRVSLVGATDTTVRSETIPLRHIRRTAFSVQIQAIPHPLFGTALNPYALNGIGIIVVIPIDETSSRCGPSFDRTYTTSHC
jgi:hypothetical protein